MVHADAARRVMVIPLTGAVPDRPDINRSFSRAVSRVAAVGGSEVLDADVSLEDAAALVGCMPKEGGCLDEIAQSLGVEEILFGRLEPAAGGAVRVSLTYHRLGDTVERSFEVAAGDVANQARQVARETASLLSGHETPPPVEPDPTPTPVPTPVTDPVPTPVVAPPPEGDQPGALGRVRARSWIALGAGVALSGAGALFYTRARSGQAEIDDAPTETPDDFRRLVDLEADADRDAMIGNALVIAGGAALITGAVLAVLDSRSSRAERRSSSVRVVPTTGGAQVFLTMELP
ncbi:MAG TPA: hypothetical protein VML75_06580 [Kofleriaceae bacterium]|nr:hypothetical protein [Kofleriaceae bacterium]